MPSDISAEVPETCNITFAQVLSRHGGRYPTRSKSIAYKRLVHRIQDNVDDVFSRKYAFFMDYTYELRAEDLTEFGKQQMVNSGTKFYQRYITLAENESPFYRAASGERVVESALKFSKGFSAAKWKDGRTSVIVDKAHMVILDEDKNNTLSHGTCPAFENNRPEWQDSAEAVFADIFVPPVRNRLNEDLNGADLSISETIMFMDLCPFETMASRSGKMSPFCDLFTVEEWKQYDYYQALNKYYGFSFGSDLGPTQGVGWVNELIARLTGNPVQDQTNTNHTLDSDPRTFPLGRTLYADFSHDNDMISIFSAMGLYNLSMTPALSKTRQHDAQDLGGFSASWAVPFAARMYVEKMQCEDEEEELVRVLINDRVVPLQGCDADVLGRCRVRTWVESLGFARSNGLWKKCYD